MRALGADGTWRWQRRFARGGAAAVRRPTAACIILPIVALAPGCTVVREKPAASGPSGRAAPAGVELSLFTWTEAPEAEANQKLIDEFHRANPGIAVELQNQPGSKEAMAKLQALISGNQAPDVVSLHGAYYIPLASKGALLDIEPLINQTPDFNLADFDQRLVKLCRYQGKLYSLPRYTSVYTLFYNQDLFDNAGVKYPDQQKPWDWDAYLRTARQLTRDTNNDGKTETWGCVIDFWEARMYPWLWQNGADVFNQDRTRCVLDSPEAIEAVKFVRDLRYVYKITPPTDTNERSQALDMFTQGNIAMYMTGPWDVQTLHEASKSQGLRWAVTPLPSRKRRATMLGTENYAICSQTKHPEEAWKLFAFLLSPHAQEYMGETMEKMPSRTSVVKGAYVEAQVDYNRQVFADALSYAVEPPNIADWAQVRPLFQDELDNIWTGTKTPEQGMKDAARRINEYRAKG
jgi:multiple sugar transport system substrate-binding protein